MSNELVSKVLILDEHREHADIIKTFCEENNLIALRVKKGQLTSVLQSNIDLGAILYAENYGGSSEENARIAAQIHSERPELPIILRRETTTGLNGIEATLQRVCCATYSINDLSSLKKCIDEYIFSLVYPNALVRGISEISESVLARQFQQYTVRWDTPCLVRDRLIFGEVFSLMPLESAWCRGYMMLQAEEQPILDLLPNGDHQDSEPDFRSVNSMLGEITNLIWGAFKNRYIEGATTPSAVAQIQVPLIVNHKHKYISFGTDNPQLCFLYTLTDEATGQSIKLYQRFVFNLNWSPDDFRENTHDADALFESGLLELF